MKGSTSPVRENVSPVSEQRKFPVRELSLFHVRKDQSPLRVTSKTGTKRQGGSNDSKKEKRSGQVRRFLISMPHKQMAMIQNLEESHRVCRV